MSSSLCFVGLGNVGAQYKDHRHNVGAQFIERLASYLNIELQSHPKTHCRAATIDIRGVKIHLVIPECYMNESGLFVAQYLHFYKIAVEDLVVVHDELDFLPGQLRYKAFGGHGGHNGLRNIQLHLNSDRYKRLRIGIGHPGQKDKVAGYVLSRPPLNEHQLIAKLFDDIISLWPQFASREWDKIAMHFHKNAV